MKRWREIEIAGVSVESVLRPGLARTLVRATFGSVGVRFVGLGLTFGVGVLLARLLGPAGYGLYGTILSIAALLAVPAQFGLPQLVTREVAATQSRGDNAEIRSIILWFLAIVTGGIVVMVLIGLVGFHAWPDQPDNVFASAYQWGLALIPVTALMALGMGALRGFKRVVSSQVYEGLVRPALMVVCLLVLTLMQDGISTRDAIALQVVTGGVAIILCYFHMIRIAPKAERFFKTNPFRRSWVSSAVPMTGTEVMRSIDGQYAILLLSLLAPMDQVGIFRIALAVVAFMALPATIVGLVVMPFIAQLHAEKNVRSMQIIATGSALVCFVSTLLMTVFLYLFGQTIIPMLFGIEYALAWWPLLVLSIGYTVSGMFGTAAMILNMSGKEKTVVAVYTIGPVIGVIATLILFPIVGIVAAAYAFVIAQVVKHVWMYLSARKELGVDVSIFSALRMVSAKQL